MLPLVPGFPSCRTCAFCRNAPRSLCRACRSATAPAGAHVACVICAQPLSAARHGVTDCCRNRLCGDPARAFERVWAITNRSGSIHRAIAAYKYGNRHFWAPVFARFIADAILPREATACPQTSADPETWDPRGWDLLIASPTFIAPTHPVLRLGHGAAFPPTHPPGFGHTELVVEHCQALGRAQWPFPALRAPVLIRTEPGPRLAGASFSERRQMARALGRVLKVCEPSLVEGQRVLVYDDIFTTGTTLQAIAKVLRDAGAAAVGGLVLTRQAWREANACQPSTRSADPLPAPSAR